MKEIIDLLPYFVAIFFCILFFDLCFAKINKQKLKITKRNISIIIISTLIVLFNNLNTNLFLKVIINLITISINFKIIFKNDLKYTIISYIILYLILMLFELLTTNILTVINILPDSNSAIDLTFPRLFLSISVNLEEYIILSIKRFAKWVRKLVNFLYVNASSLNIAYLIFITISIIGILNTKFFAENNSVFLILLLFITFAIFLGLIIYLKVQETILKDTNKKLIDYNDKYGKFLDEYKIYKHNIKHKLSAIKSYGNKRVNALIDDLLEEETNFSVKNNNLYKVPSGIKGIVAEKLYNANLNVIVDNKIKNDPFSRLSPKAFNSISECIGIALDNAVEASEVTENPIILMDLFEDEENIFIKIGNNFCNSIDIDELGSIYYSTKNRGSGLGLFSIRRNNFVKEKIDIINDFYYIKLQIKKAR